jgi:hypothetical protein
MMLAAVGVNPTDRAARHSRSGFSCGSNSSRDHIYRRGTRISGKSIHPLRLARGAARRSMDKCPTAPEYGHVGQKTCR